jgi:cephalosporin hydroxylase
MGRPIIQLPEDMIRAQEVIWQIKPDVLVETGVAHGGSLVFYASLFKAMGKGRVIGVEVDLRPENRAALVSHPLADWITLVDGSSVDNATIERVRALIKPGATVVVILDSNHTKEHVLAELRRYSGFVSIGSYIIATDGIMELLAGGPRTGPDWTWNNPRQAVLEFITENPDFQLSEPAWAFNEGVASARVTYWPDAFIRRIR